jgi:hypothetical protein
LNRDGRDAWPGMLGVHEGGRRGGIPHLLRGLTRGVLAPVDGSWL